jgi:hypothetical protein
MSNSGARRWIDLPPASVSMGAGLAALTQQTIRDTPAPYDFFRHDQIDRFSLRYQMPHHWVVGSVLRPHAHVIPCGPDAGVVVLSGRLAWTHIGSGHKLPAWSGWTPFRATKSILAADQYDEIVIGIGDVTPPSWASWSSHLHVVWERPGGAGGDADDTYESANPDGVGAANLALASFDCHALIEGDGTRLEFSEP